MTLPLICGIAIGVLYTVAIALTGAGLRTPEERRNEGCLGALYRVFGGGIMAGAVAFGIAWFWIQF